MVDIYLSNQRSEERRIALARDLCERNGYCGQIQGEFICVKSATRKHECVYRTLIVKMVPFG